MLGFQMCCNYMTNILINLKKINILIIKANSIIQFIINKKCKSTSTKYFQKKYRRIKQEFISNKIYAIF